MSFAVGAALALAAAGIATVVGFDRDRAFYPTMLVVIASYYDLFAVIGGSGPAFGMESLIFAAFVAVSVIGFRSNLWIVVGALAAHGALDLVHGRLISNPGVPAWWPMFCLSFDGVAAAYLAWRLLRSVPRRQGLEGLGQRARSHARAEWPLLSPRSMADLVATGTHSAGTGVLVLIMTLVACAVLGVDPARAAPDDVHIAKVDGHQVAYRVLGSGRPILVMIGGLGEQMSSFGDIAPDLARSATVVVYDRAGYGASTPAPGPRDAEAQARELTGLLAQSGIAGPYVLAGHSNGGLIAEYLAAKNPDLVAGLILEEPRPADFSRRCAAAKIGMCAAPAWMVRFMPTGAQAEYAAMTATMAEVEAAGRADGKPVLILSRPSCHLPRPLDALWNEAQADLARGYPGSRHLTARSGGHDLHRDQRAWFTTTVGDFLARPAR